MHQLAEGQDPTDFDLFTKAANGDPFAAREIHRRLHPILNRYAAIFARKLAPDLREDVVQQAWLILAMRSNDAWFSGRIPRDVYLRGIARDAAEAIRAEYRHADEVCRPRNQRIKLANCTEHPSHYDGVLEGIPERINRENAVGARLELLDLYGRASPEVRTALVLLCEEGATLETAAAAAGITRRTLCRRLDGLRAAA